VARSLSVAAWSLQGTPNWPVFGTQGSGLKGSNGGNES